MYDVAVVGGGAAGLMAAITAAKSGVSVCVLEQKEKTGKKLLATGNGKCNYTNRVQNAACYRGTHPEFAACVLKQFPFEQTISFFKSIGIYPKEKNGYFYPHSEQAASVAEALLAEAERLRVTIRTGIKVLSAEKKDGSFLLSTDAGQVASSSLILATGGMAAKVHGSDGSGYTFAKKFGHTIVTPVPAIVQLKAAQSFFKTLAGVRTEGGVTLLIEGKEAAREQGELLFAAYGISGIPVMQVSRFAARALEEGKQVTALFDLFPELSKQELEQELKERFFKARQTKHKTNEQVMTGLLNHKLNYVLLKEAGIEPTKMPDSKSEQKLSSLAALIKRFPVTVTDTNGFDNAQACAGGISTEELTAQLESRLVSGLFAAGELVDIDGTCGGYNLQWAWSSGYVAGLAAAKRREKAQ